MADTKRSPTAPPGLPPGVARDYGITVPDSWALIPLQPGDREKATGAVLDHRHLFPFPVPGSGTRLLLAFSGPDGPLAPAMSGLFDAIAGMLRWAG